MKKLLMVSVILVLFFSFSCVTAQDNSTDNLTVENTQNTLKTSATFENIQKMVDNAKSGDTILLEGNYVGSGKEITINKKVTLDGQSKTVLDAKDKSRILNINAENVVIKNIKFINANARYNFYEDGDYDSEYVSGGAVNLKGNNALITNCLFDKCQAFGYENCHGGAVYIEGNSNKITNCNFTNNHCLSLGVGGGALSLDGKNALIKNCIFDNNYAETGEAFTYGGAAFILSKNCEISGCTFKNNYLKYYYPSKDKSEDISEGGALYVYGKNAVVKNNIFQKNKATVGGALAVGEKTIKVTGNIFKSNKALCEDDVYGFYTNTVKVSGKYYKGITVTIKMKNKITSKALKNVKLYAYNAKTNKKIGNVKVKNGVGKFIIPLKKGTHKIYFRFGGVNFEDESINKVITKPIKVTVKKAPAKFKAKKLVAKQKSEKTFNVKLKNTKTKKSIAKVKVNIKIFTGKKSKTYTINTDSNGYAKLKISKLKVGKHKVVVSTNDKNLIIKSIKSSIKIK